jgi:hypothetical protein
MNRPLTDSDLGLVYPKPPVLAALIPSGVTQRLLAIVDPSSLDQLKTLASLYHAHYIEGIDSMYEGLDEVRAVAGLFGGELRPRKLPREKSVTVHSGTYSHIADVQWKAADLKDQGDGKQRVLGISTSTAAHPDYLLAIGRFVVSTSSGLWYLELGAKCVEDAESLRVLSAGWHNAWHAGGLKSGLERPLVLPDASPATEWSVGESVVSGGSYNGAEIVGAHKVTGVDDRVCLAPFREDGRGQGPVGAWFKTK